MGAGDKLSLWGLMLVILPGVLGRDWKVKFPDNPVCTVRGSTVLIHCEYDYPSEYKVTDRMWCLNDRDCIETSYVCHSQDLNLTQGKDMEPNRHRAKCLGDKKKNCTLKITNIRKTDAGEYRFRFTTDKEDGKWTSLSGLNLIVYELKVVMTSSGVNGTLREGDSVNLTCDTGSCSHSQSEFTWFKDNQHLPETQSTLQFDPVSHHHFGKYSCALNRYKETVSAVFILNAQYDSHMTTLLIIVGLVLPVLIVVFLMVFIVRRKKGSRLSKEPSGMIADEHVRVPAAESKYSPSTALRQEASPQEEEVSYAAIHFNTKPPVKRPMVTEQTEKESMIYSSVFTATNRVK